MVALVSGGKDSCYAMYLAQQEGHEIVALANLLPAEHQPDELDSFMYQTVRGLMLALNHPLLLPCCTCTQLLP